MAGRTANVTARIEPEVKEQAEAIMEQLGLPVSVVINALYKQIVYQNGIPFSLTLPAAPRARDEMTDEVFGAAMQEGLDAARTGRSRAAADVFSELRREL